MQVFKHISLIIVLFWGVSISSVNAEDKKNEQEQFQAVVAEDEKSTEEDLVTEDGLFLENGVILLETINKDDFKPVKLNMSKDELTTLFNNGDEFKEPIKLEVTNFDPENINLQDLIYEGLDRNLELKITEKDSKVAKWNFWQEFSNALPDFTASAGIQKLDGTFFFNSNLQGDVNETQNFANLRGEWRAFDGGKTTMLILAERFIKKSTDQTKVNQFNLTVLNAIELYNSLLLAQSSLQSRSKALKEAKSNLLLTKNYYEIGTGTYYEFLQAKARFASAQQSLLTQEANFRKAQVSIANFLNMDLEKQFFVEKEYVDKISIIDDEMEFGEFKKITMKKNPLIKQALYDEKAARRKNYSSYGDYLPKLDLYMQLSALGNDFDDLNNVTTLGGQMTLEFGRGAGLYTVSENFITKNQLDRAKLIKKNTKLNIETELRLAYLDYETSQSNMIQANEQLKASEEALRLSKMRYQNGIEIINDLVQNETALSNAEVNMISSITSYNNAQARLAFLMGDIKVDQILKN